MTEKDDLPEFHVQARPLCVPLELANMNAADDIRYVDDVGTGHGRGTTTAGEFLKDIRATITRQAAGFFTLNEASQILSDATGSSVKTQLEKLRRGIAEKELNALDQDDKMPVLGAVKNFSSVLRVSDMVAAGFAFPNAPQPAPAQNTTTTAAVVAASEWVIQAQIRAQEIVKESRARDLYPSQENLGDQIASEFRKAGITGAGGKPLSGATIKRHALKGISSATGKQLSTTIGRGK